MTRSELLDVVYRFYPRGLLTFGGGYDDTQEFQRQRDAVRRGASEYPTWNAMIRRLEARYPLMDHSVRILGGGREPAYSAHIEIHGHKLGFHVSLLGPYYGIHRTGAACEEPAALDLAQEIEATYPGYDPIPPALGDEVVPDVGLDSANFGEATIYLCLLSEDWKWISGPFTPLPSPVPCPPGREFVVFATKPGRDRDDPPIDNDEQPEVIAILPPRPARLK